MSSEQKCVFCNNSISETKITLFNNKILEKCKKILKIRVTYKLKYNELILPTTPDKINGYHGNCYSNFTAIKRKYVDNYSELVKLQQSGNTIPEPDPSNNELIALFSESQATLSCQPSTSSTANNESTALSSESQATLSCQPSTSSTADINEIESEDDIDCESEEDMQYDESDANSEIE
ncbi:uncharacterized protein LOC143897631 [Temnothorax americanus]|uniref:uncharacterized protein LOC143897631 n=1 Tax=Temnothorax americanus TaxID=1964332 RepID=UPI004067D64C